MRNKDIYFKLLFSYFLIISLTVIITFFSFFLILKKEINREVSNDLITITKSLKEAILNDLNKTADKIQNNIIRYGKELDVRITLIKEDGTVLADSNYDPKFMENHLLREEVQSAFMGNPKVFKRHSTTLNEEMYYYAILLNYNDQKIILRVSFFTKLFKKIYKEILQYLIIIFFSVFFIGIIISYLFSSNISKNFKTIYNFLKKISQGDFEERIFLEKPKEFKELSNLLNKTAENLEEIFIKEKKEKEEISAIIENIKDPLAIIDQNGKIAYANSSFLNIFFKDSFIDLHYWEVINSIKVIELLEEHLKSKKEVNEEIKITEKTFLLTIKNLKEIKEILLILHDITSYKEIVRIKKELVSNISHEIKTPLTVISGYLEILEEKLKNEELEILKKIQNQIKDVSSLTEEMLYLSGIEEGKIFKMFDKIDILKPIEKAIDTYKIPFEKKGLFIKKEFEEKILKIFGSEKLIERLFLNLLDNSLKFTKEGGVFIRVNLKEDKLIVEFKDTGEGIREEDLPFIFERFYLSEKRRTKGKSGFGLGLSIVKHIIEQHTGKIDVKSALGKGTIFTISFPI